MNCRPRGGKPAMALWMLVAVIDLVLLAAAVGAVVSMLIIAVLTVLAGGVAAARLLTKRETPRVTARRRA